MSCSVGATLAAVVLMLPLGSMAHDGSYIPHCWARVIRMAYQKSPDAAFALHAGDLINLADYGEIWA